jgi:hypothetical protein
MLEGRAIKEIIGAKKKKAEKKKHTHNLLTGG